MKKFAVGFLDFNENNLIIELIEAPGWNSAISKHSLASDFIFSGGLSLEAVKQEAFDQDAAIDVVEII